MLSTLALPSLNLQMSTDSQTPPTTSPLEGTSQEKRSKASVYKDTFVRFIVAQPWHWFITIPIGQCENDDRVISDIRKIEAILCGRYLTKRYNKLPSQCRYQILIAFEGERETGNRHAHLLAYVPRPIRRKIPYVMAISLFAQEFRFLWNSYRPALAPHRLRSSCAGDSPSDVASMRSSDEILSLNFQRATNINKIYTVKGVQLNEVPWSRLEFATPPKSKPFLNQNLTVIRNRNRQRRAKLGLN